jgi:hypothetical protein
MMQVQLGSPLSFFTGVTGAAEELAESGPYA